MTAKLYIIPISHSAATARLMLDYKKIDYQTVRLISGLHPLQLRLAGFSGTTVPALKAEGRKVQGSLAISRFLDELKPEPPLFPEDRQKRTEVAAAENWGERTLQDVPRRLFRWALIRDNQARKALARANRLPFSGIAAQLMKPVAIYFAHRSGADDETVRRHLAELPDLLDEADRLVEKGIIGVDQPNAATFQIGPNLRLLMNIEALTHLFSNRPCADFARQLLPDYPGWISVRFPAAGEGGA